MSSFLILCGETTLPLHQYDNIAVINIFLLDSLQKKGIDAVDLFGIDPEIDEIKATHEIDFRLHQESVCRKEMLWAPLALERTVRRYLHYLQFKRRIEKWLLIHTPTALEISSGWDKDLVTAASVICKAQGINLVVHSGQFDLYTGLQPFLSAEVLPRSNDLSSLLLIKIFGWWARLRNVSTLYEPYTNLMGGYGNADSFRWWKSIATVRSLYKYVNARLKLIQSSKTDLDLSFFINSNDQTILDSSIWSNFPSDERQAINSGIHNFRSNHSDDHLNQIYIALKSFFRTAKAQRLIVLDAQLSHSRMLIYAAKKSKMNVDLLPHGLTFEDYTRNTDGPFSPDRVLAWNDASRDRYSQLGMNSITISHERNRSWVEPICRDAKSITTMNVLVLLSSSVPLQLDAFERMFMQVYSALEDLGIQQVKWKAHNAGPKITEIQNFTLERLARTFTLKLDVIEARLDTQLLMSGFDFVVMIGPTSGIFEAARIGIPFVVFGGQPERAGCLNGFEIPCAGSKKDLVEAIIKFDYQAHESRCKALSGSLNEGMDPFGGL